MELISEETDGLACFEYAGQRREKLGLHGAGNAILPCPVLSCTVLYCTVLPEPFPFSWLRKSVFAAGIYAHCIAASMYIRP